MDDTSPCPEPDAADLLPSRSFGYRLWLVRHAWTRRMEAALAPTGLTHMQFFMLRAAEHAAQQGRAPSQSGMAEWLRTDGMTVSKVVRILEAKGLLARAIHPDDPRAKCVTLTPAGLDAMWHASRLVHMEQERFFGRLGRNGKAAFGRMLDTLLEQEACPSGPPGNPAATAPAGMARQPAARQAAARQAASRELA